MVNCHSLVQYVASRELLYLKTRGSRESNLSRWMVFVICSKSCLKLALLRLVHVVVSRVTSNDSISPTKKSRAWVMKRARKCSFCHEYVSESLGVHLAKCSSFTADTIENEEEDDYVPPNKIPATRVWCQTCNRYIKNNASGPSHLLSNGHLANVQLRESLVRFLLLFCCWRSSPGPRLKNIKQKKLQNAMLERRKPLSPKHKKMSLLLHLWEHPLQCYLGFKLCRNQMKLLQVFWNPPWKTLTFRSPSR